MAMCKSGDARWTALLGQWLVGVGVLRYKRLRLSTVLKVRCSLLALEGNSPSSEEDFIGAFPLLLLANFTPTS